MYDLRVEALYKKFILKWSMNLYCNDYETPKRKKEKE